MTFIFSAALTLAFSSHPSFAEEDAKRPSVLVIDAGMGDGDLAVLHWLGEDSEVLADKEGLVLSTAQSPSWWNTQGGGDAAPASFVLHGAEGAAPITSDSIVWALDQIRNAGANPKTFVIATGTPGLRLREYAEDLGTTKQSDRADIVGLGFFGTPHNGYSTINTYPELQLWSTAANAAGMSTQDITPGSELLAELNAHKVPDMCKTISVAGTVGDLGFGATDGAGVMKDFTPVETVFEQIEPGQAKATITRSGNLTSQWKPFTSTIDYPDRAVDTQLAERLSAMDSYIISDEAKSEAKSFYETWFSEGAPVTHNANILALDLSGSMLESIGSNETKLNAAKVAAKEYLRAANAYDALPYSAPVDVRVLGFNTAVQEITDSYDDAAQASIDSIEARGETNIGAVLDKALDELGHMPACADKRILLLSDGATTQGKSEDEMLSGPIANAKRDGVVIDAIGFGDIGESDAGFLKAVSQETGGTYYQASDTYELEVNFLKSYYSSLGFALIDKEIADSAAGSESLGNVETGTAALNIGIVSKEQPPSVTLLRDGTPLDEAAYTISEKNGVTSVQCLNPVAGEYSIECKGGKGQAHVFAVAQRGMGSNIAATANQHDYSLLFLIGGAAVLVAAIAAVLVRSRKRRKKE